MHLFAEYAPSSAAMLALVSTVLVAAWHDWTSWRIPNRLLAASASAALMLALFAPNGVGIRDSLLGGLLGLALFLPLYLMRGMAAGDVKLVATVGLYAGPPLTADVALLSCIAGGAWALLYVAAQGPRWQVLRLRLEGAVGPKLARIVCLSQQPQVRAVQGSGVIPYAVAIAVGTLGALWLAQPPS